MVEGSHPLPQASQNGPPAQTIGAPMAKRNKKTGKVKPGTCRVLPNGACVCKDLSGTRPYFAKKQGGRCPM